MFLIFCQILRFLIKITWFLSFSGKNDAESLCHFVKNLFLNPKRAKLDQKVEIWTCPDLPRPVQEDKYLLQTSGNTSFFLEIARFHFLSTNLSFFMKSYVLLSRFIISYKIICFTKEIYEDKSLSQNNVFAFISSDFTSFLIY